MLGGAISGVICAALGVQDFTRPTMIISPWAAVLGVYLYAKTIGKTKREVLLDPKTHQEVVLARRHSFFFIPAKGWVYLSGVFAAFLTVSAVFSSGDTSSGGSFSKPKALSDAEQSILSESRGTSHGNTPQAAQLAAEFGKGLKSFREAVITESKKSTFSLTGGEFLTHCQISDHGIAFIVHVPSLRKFTQEAKDAIAMGAQTLAVALAKKVTPTPARVAVGIRGSILYDRVTVVELSPADASAGHTTEGKEEKLSPFFQEPSSKQTEATPIHSPGATTTPSPTPAQESPPTTPKAPAAEA